MLSERLLESTEHHRLTSLSSAAWDCPGVEFSSNQYSTVMTCKHNEQSMSDGWFKGTPHYLLQTLRVPCHQSLQRMTLDIERRWRKELSWLLYRVSLLLRCSFCNVRKVFYLLKVAYTKKIESALHKEFMQLVKTELLRIWGKVDTQLHF